jgi:hypothetical protein
MLHPEISESLYTGTCTPLFYLPHYATVSNLAVAARPIDSWKAVEAPIDANILELRV